MIRWLICLLVPALAAAEPTWEETLEAAVPAVVALRTTTPRAFDTSGAGSGVATGFVVDAERGLILTNRHVVKPGPVLAEATFADHEEVRLQAVYRDPVHDFGFFRFDPAALEHQDVVALRLAPDAAKVGAEVRILGNDAGEKLSILEGTLARLDRFAPYYGVGRYNDFNTFYFQAASGTSGGSSGSPVLDRQGRVVALNAGSKRSAASSFYLPLDRVQRALSKLQAGEPVTRGTLQITLLHRPFDELARLGLTDAAEAEARAELGGHGLLSVERVGTGGPADGVLQPGDIVLALDGAWIDGFVPWEAVLDERVGAPVVLTVERGGERMEVELTVGDLHAITPSGYLEVGGAVLHDLSYQKARQFPVPVQGVYVADDGYLFETAGIPNGAVIEALGDAPTPDLDALQVALQALPEGARVAVAFRMLADHRRLRVEPLELQRSWHPLRRCAWDGAGWPCVDLPPPTAAEPLPPVTAAVPKPAGKHARRYAPSLVHVAFRTPYRTDGVPGQRYAGTGVIVDAERGLVLVDRDTVPVLLGEVTLTFGGAVEVPATIEWLHPKHDFGFVRYDPAALGDTPVRAATLTDDPLPLGEEVFAVGLSRSLQVLQVEAKVARREWFAAPAANPPRFRQVNADVVILSAGLPITGGLLVDAKGRARALWVSEPVDRGREDGALSVGLPAARALPALRALQRGERPALRSLGVELAVETLPDAARRGVPAGDVAALAAAGGDRPGALVVLRVDPDGPAAAALQPGDVLLDIDGAPAVRMAQLERAEQAAAVALRFWRRGEQTASVPTEPLPPAATDRAVLWAGLLLQAPHLAMTAQEGLPRRGVYVALWWRGSPAHRYGMRSQRFITAVNGVPVDDLDGFLAAVGGLPEGAVVRFMTKRMTGREQLEALRLDLQHWPTSELRLGADGWERVELD